MDDLERALASDMLTAAVEAGRQMQDVKRIQVTHTTDTSVRMLVTFNTYSPREFLLRLTEIW